MLVCIFVVSWFVGDFFVVWDLSVTLLCLEVFLCFEGFYISLGFFVCSFQVCCCFFNIEFQVWLQLGKVKKKLKIHYLLCLLALGSISNISGASTA